MADAPHRLTRLATLRGMRSWNISTGLSSVYSAITTGAYSTGYALHLGASNAVLGLLAAAPAWGQMLQLFSPLLVERVRSRKTLCLLTYAAGYSLWLLVAVIPFFVPEGYRALAMVGLVLLSGLLLAAAAPASTSWFSDLVPDEYRARFVSLNQSIGSAVGLAASLSAGWVMDQFPEEQQQPGFMVLFVVAVLFAWAAVGGWAAVPEPPKTPTQPPAPLDLIRLPLAHRDVRYFTFFAAFRTMTVMVASPFFSAFMLKTLRLPYSEIAIYSVCVTLAMLASNPLWAQLAEKFGYRPLLRISSFGVALNPLLWFFISPHNYRVVIPLAQIYGGVVAAGLLQSQFNLLLKIVPTEQRSIYLGFHAAVVNIGVALGSMLGGALADGLARWGPYAFLGRDISHYQVVFLISCLLRMMGLSFLAAVREPGALAARQVIQELRRGRSVPALIHLRRLPSVRDPHAKARLTRALGRAGSTLPIEELVALLDDSSHEVRREAVRALGEIGDPRAVEALLVKVVDPLSDVVEEAVEALAAIPGRDSAAALAELLEDPRPSVRRCAAQGLGMIGGPAEAELLQQLLRDEVEPDVLLAAYEALGQIGGADAFDLLRQALPATPPGPARQVLTGAVGNLLGPTDWFYQLLEGDRMTQAARVSKLLAQSRRQLERRRDLGPRSVAFLRGQEGLAAHAFDAEEYSVAIRALRRAAGRAVLSVARGRVGTRLLAGDPEFRADLPGYRRRDLLLAKDEHLRRAVVFLRGLARRHGSPPFRREEALLAAFAFSQVAAGLARLEALARRE